MGLNTPTLKKKVQQQTKKKSHKKNYPFLPSKKALHT